MTDPALLAVAFACAVRGWREPPPPCTVRLAPPPVVVPVLTEAEEAQADMVASRVVRLWRPAVELLAPDMDADLILALIAQESAGYSDAVSNDGWASLGLMQVLPRWAPPGANLYNPGTNIVIGSRILRNAITLADGDLRTGLAYYNCGEAGVHAGACGDFGGYVYADRILGMWLPRIRRLMWSPSGLALRYGYL